MNSRELMKGRIKQTILELCSEDDWGSWELWWNVVASNASDIKCDLKADFISVVQEMVRQGQLVPKRHHSDGVCVPDKFDENRFANDLDNVDNVDIDNFYWFGTV